MKEIVSLHIGQAGNQTGFAIWELLCAEHGIKSDGECYSNNESQDRSFETFFLESHTGKFVPRGLFIDLEPTVIDQLRKGSYSKLYNPMQLINGGDDSSSNFARAFHTVGRLLFVPIQNQLRRQIESCDYMELLMIHRALAGGAGSGLTAMVFELLDEYSKTIKLEFSIYPAPHFDSSVIAPYNSILAEHFCMDECDIGLLLDNEALFDICSNNLEIKYPTMTTINRILGQVCSSLTAATRFHNDLCNDLTVVLTNLVPYPRIHFPLVSFSPIWNNSKFDHEKCTITNITKAVFDNCSQLVKCDPSSGKYMSCSLVYRGLLSPCEVYSTLGELKKSRKLRFVDWCPTGFKIGIVDQPPLILPESKLADTNCNVVMMTNSSSVSAVWQRLSQKFHVLYSKRSFIHWFVGEGLEESEFCEALYNLATLAKDYEEVAVDTEMQQSKFNEEGTIVNAEESGEGANAATKASKPTTIEEEGSSGEDSNDSNINKIHKDNFNKRCNDQSRRKLTPNNYNEFFKLERDSMTNYLSDLSTSSIMPSNTNSNNKMLKAKPPKSIKNDHIIDSNDEDNKILKALVSLTSTILVSLY